MYRNLFVAWYCLGVLALVLVSALIFILLFGWKGAEGSPSSAVGGTPLLFFRTQSLKVYTTSLSKLFLTISD